MVSKAIFALFSKERFTKEVKIALNSEVRQVQCGHGEEFVALSTKDKLDIFEKGQKPFVRNDFIFLKNEL